jgi:hypothetical protein
MVQTVSDTVEAGCQSSRGRSRLNQADGIFTGNRTVCNPAVGKHNVKFSTQAQIAKIHTQLIQIPLGQGLDIDIGSSSGGTLVFSNLRHDLTGEGTGGLRGKLRKELFDEKFMGRVAKRVKKADGNCFYPITDKPLDHFPDLLWIQRAKNLTRVVKALGYLSSQISGN